ncbi:hypothetical protein M594_04845 [Streptococcus mitis]|uniref:Uncharacterized protein n=1 Tax=Streptococcus mitis TaxID=28037 RepID=A0A6M9EZ34_STRMT|nr:hypothetical protein M594_04845 [Streptococcus mitis]
MAHGQSDSNLGHKGQAVADTRTKSDSNLGRKGQAVADTRINRLTRWLTGSVSHLFYFTLIVMFYILRRTKFWLVLFFVDDMLQTTYTVEY